MAALAVPTAGIKAEAMFSGSRKLPSIATPNCAAPNRKPPLERFKVKLNSSRLSYRSANKLANPVLIPFSPTSMPFLKYSLFWYSSAVSISPLVPSPINWSANLPNALAGL